MRTTVVGCAALILVLGSAVASAAGEGTTAVERFVRGREALVRERQRLEMLRLQALQAEQHLKRLEAQLKAQEYRKDPSLLVGGNRDGKRRGGPPPLAAFRLPPATTPEAVPASRGMRVRAVALRGDGGEALLETRHGLLLVSRGSLVDGWRVTRVTADGVTLVRGRKTRFLPVAGGVEERGRDRPRITSTPFPPAMPKGRSR